MKSVPLSASLRTATRHTAVKKLRATGRVPAVIYGRQVQPQTLEINGEEFNTLLHHSASENVLVDLAVAGDARPQRLALVQEVQHHPISRRVLHVDFHEVKADEMVTLHVPVETTGESVGVKNGGILEHVLFKLKVRALPKDLPEALLVDVTNLDIGKIIHLGEIPQPPNVEILGDKHVPVIAVVAPLTEEQEAAAAAAAAGPAEVEMIKEKKEEGEEGAVAPAAEGKAGDKTAKAAAPAEKAAPAKEEKKAERKK
ncbi:MAG: 50S ribosomal protein L25 [Verrucomicrobia bacterium]|nr:50S ribosomal protein L25 [Verrucomicrobiota bacterium]